MTVKFALPPTGISGLVGMRFMSMWNEYEVLSEMTVVEDTCDLLVPVVVTCVPFELVVVVELWPAVDPESVPPNTKTIEPKPSSKTITTAATDLFNPSPRSENVGTRNPFLRFGCRSHGRTITSPAIGTDLLM